jgi:crossover junction endodeoxyribonuclease RuvC
VRTAGLDPATCTGLALVGEDEDRGKTIHIKKERGFLRLQLIANEVSETLHTWDPLFVAVEGYAYVRNVSSFVTLVEIGTAIRIALKQMDMSWVEVPPTVLKKWTTGRGNATKDEMALAVNQRWGFHSHSHDIVDAIALAQMAQLGWKEVQEIHGVTVGWTNFR